MYLRFCLPFPPSVNTYWRAFKNRNILSAKGRQYQIDALSTIDLLRASGVVGVHSTTADVGVTLTLVFPDRRRRDIDNYTKATLDVITKSGIWLDDSQVKALHLLHGGYVKGGRVEVEIETL